MKTTEKISQWSHRIPWCIAINLLMVYVCYMVCRAAFIIENLDIVGTGLDSNAIWSIIAGGLRFDSSAIFYTNTLYLLLVLLPLHYMRRHVMHVVAKWLFVVVNAICIVLNLVDCVYYAFSQKRTTVLILDEFSGNTNITRILGIEMINHWYFVVLAALLIYALIKGYRDPHYERSLKPYYLRQGLSLVVMGVLCVCAMRGNFFATSSRPIAMADAHQYVSSPDRAAIVVNTPFSLIRTATKRQASVPQFYASESEVEQYYSAVHLPIDSILPDKKNVVILIVESLAEEFVGSRNRGLDGGSYKGYTPFVDSLLRHSLTFEHTYSNGWLSIDAMPSVLASVPKMYTSFILTPYALDDVPGIAKELRDWGYHTAFFHGAENTSMGFQAFARSAGFQEYYGRTEYDADPDFGGEKDFDGTWAIWDEEFLQYFCKKLGQMPQPFLASLFTASSHHPFHLPERYQDVYLEEGKYPLHKCIRYTDNALRLFFEAASKEPWFENTLFVITADHASSRITHDVYRTELGDFRIPILFYDPSGKMPTGTQPGIAQQIDIMPTILSYLGYDKPYVAFGKDILGTDAEDTWSFNWHNVPQYVKGEYLLQYNGFKPTGLYKFATDSLLKDNLIGTDRYDKDYVNQMERELQALMQEASTRMKEDRLRIQ